VTGPGVDGVVERLTGGVATWQPSEELLLDVRHCLAVAPRSSAEDRFEAWAWRALLDEQRSGLLTKAAAPSHVTASAVVVTADAASTCLVLHGKLGLWVQPGGHLEPDDVSVAGAAAREVAEETGLTGAVLPVPVLLSRHRSPCRPGVVDWHLDVQFALVAPVSVPVVSSESRDVAWFGVDALPPDIAPGLGTSVSRTVQAVRSQTGLSRGGSPAR
jgi:8-oxo-dGTP pyrophosphatase MutT (NUDIX family)